jgi:hypothetical protein
MAGRGALLKVSCATKFVGNHKGALLDSQDLPTKLLAGIFAMAATDPYAR